MSGCVLADCDISILGLLAQTSLSQSISVVSRLDSVRCAWHMEEHGITKIEVTVIVTTSEASMESPSSDVNFRMNPLRETPWNMNTGTSVVIHSVVSSEAYLLLICVGSSSPECATDGASMRPVNRIVHRQMRPLKTMETHRSRAIAPIDDDCGRCDASCSRLAASCFSRMPVGSL